MRFRGAYRLQLYKSGLRDEIVREYYDPAWVSANINPVCSWTHFIWASRINVPRTGWDLLKTANISI